MHNKKLATAALTIAGSDSCGGAGIQADLKTFSAFGVYGASVITALTAQNTASVVQVSITEPEMVAAQLYCVLDDLPVGAIKTGMLGHPATISMVVKILQQQDKLIPLVMDPVMIASSGAVLADRETVAAMWSLMEIAVLVTPNSDEAAALTGIRIRSNEDMHRAGLALLDAGCRAVLLKGGHQKGSMVTDVLFGDGVSRKWQHQRREGNFHGTGCTLSAAITAGIASGNELEQAIDDAIAYVMRTMDHGKLARTETLVLLNHEV